MVCIHQVIVLPLSQGLKIILIYIHYKLIFNIVILLGVAFLHERCVCAVYI